MKIRNLHILPDADESLQKVLDSGKFILGLDATFKPMGYTDENDEIVGFDIDVAEEVCSRLGSRAGERAYKLEN